MMYLDIFDSLKTFILSTILELSIIHSNSITLRGWIERSRMVSWLHSEKLNKEYEKKLMYISFSEKTSQWRYLLYSYDDANEKIKRKINSVTKYF